MYWAPIFSVKVALRIQTPLRKRFSSHQFVSYPNTLVRNQLSELFSKAYKRLFHIIQSANFVHEQEQKKIMSVLLWFVIQGVCFHKQDVVDVAGCRGTCVNYYKEVTEVVIVQFIFLKVIVKTWYRHQI